MATFILIHGAWHGAWCWERVVPLLEAGGHEVFAPDLPAMGEDGTDPRNVTLADNVTRIGEELEKASGPAILVGHSLGGISITQAGEVFAEKISRLVYLTAFLPMNGESRLDIAMPETGLHQPTYIQLSEDRKTTTVADEVIAPNYYHDCDAKTVAWAKARLKPQPLVIGQTPVQTTPDRWGALPRAYIVCADDRSIPIAFQEYMCRRAACDPVITMQTSHSPFLSAPDELAAHLDSLAG